MRKEIVIGMVCMLFVIAAGCSILQGGKPGTGGKNSAESLKQTAHPEVPEGVRCYVCHKNEMPQAPFHQTFGRECEQCHVQNTWIASKYPHEKWTLGIHREMQCIRCHTEIQSYDFSVWQCWGCHHDQTETIASHKKMGYDDITNCLSCHHGSPEPAPSSDSNS